MCIYELKSEQLQEDVQVWRDIGIVQYYSLWAQSKWVKDSGKFIYCTQVSPIWLTWKL